MPRVAVDTNLLVYLEGFDDSDKQAFLKDLFGSLAASTIVVPVQVLGELHRVLVRKHRKKPPEATRICNQYARTFEIWPTSVDAFAQASLLTSAHGMAIWDAVILSAAAEARFGILLSEDVFYNAETAGVAIVNPFAHGLDALLNTLLSPS